MEKRDRCKVWFRTSTGFSWCLIITGGKKGNWGANIATKECAECGQTFMAPLYLKTSKVKTDRRGHRCCYLYDSPYCRECEPQAPVDIFCDSEGILRMRIGSLRDERGEPYRIEDKKTGQWRKLSAFGIRRMAKKGNEFRLQPYKDRTHDKQGTPYGNAKR